MRVHTICLVSPWSRQSRLQARPDTDTRARLAAASGRSGPGWPPAEIHGVRNVKVKSQAELCRPGINSASPSGPGLMRPSDAKWRCCYEPCYKATLHPPQHWRRWTGHMKIWLLTWNFLVYLYLYRGCKDCKTFVDIASLLCIIIDNSIKSHLYQGFP